MKFFAILPLIIPALADSFVIKAWSTNSDQFQNTQILKANSHPHVFSVGGGDGYELVLNLGDNGTLYDQDGVGINLDGSTGEMGSVDPFGGQATPGFGFNGDHLVFNGQDAWSACPSGSDQFSLALSACVGGTPIVLQRVGV